MQQQRIVFLVLCSLVFSGAMARGQVTTGTISGAVRDQSGAVLPGAGVTIRNVETGITRRVAADEQGRYRVPQLPLGNYEVEAEASGFSTEVRQGITLTIGREAVAASR